MIIFYADVPSCTSIKEVITMNSLVPGQDLSTVMRGKTGDELPKDRVVIQTSWGPDWKCPDNIPTAVKHEATGEESDV